MANLKASVPVDFAHYNFVRLQKALRVTPAMAAGVTDQLWSLQELINAATSERENAVINISIDKYDGDVEAERGRAISSLRAVGIKTYVGPRTRPPFAVIVVDDDVADQALEVLKKNGIKASRQPKGHVTDGDG